MQLRGPELQGYGRPMIEYLFIYFFTKNDIHLFKQREIAFIKNNTFKVAKTKNDESANKFTTSQLKA